MPEYIVQVAVVELFLDILLEGEKLMIVDDETLLIEGFGGQLDLRNVVVAV